MFSAISSLNLCIFLDNSTVLYMRLEEESYSLTIADEQPKPTPQEERKRVRHIYLEEENIYGRFVPYLLLKDQLESEVDSSGNTALHHMCSHNSPYIPLFLSSIPDGHPILNRKSKLGHTPLDVAGLYCNKEYIQMLKEKGAVDNGNVDFWAIQGANPANWSGKVYPQKKALIHWAAYNDMPQVIAEYAKQGVCISEPDSNGSTPIDLAVLNKSYNSLRLMAQLGEKPKPELIKSSDSQSVKELFEELNEEKWKKSLRKYAKFLSFLVFLSLCLYLSRSTINLTLISISTLIWVYCLSAPFKAQAYLNNNRKTEFTSQLLLSKPINRNNHMSYLLLHIFIIETGIYSIYKSSVTNHLIALCILVVFVFVGSYFLHFVVQVYGICRNLTYQELFYAAKWPHLWDRVRYVQERKIVVREFRNSEDRGVSANIKDYFMF